MFLLIAILNVITMSYYICAWHFIAQHTCFTYIYIYLLIIVRCLFFDGWHLTWKKHILLLYNIMICYMILCVMSIWLCEIICYDTVSVLCADYYFINGLGPPPEFDHLGLQVLNNRLSYQNRRLVGRLPGFTRDGDRGSIYRYTWYHMIFFLSGFLPVCPKAAYISVIHIIHIIYIYIVYTHFMYIYIYICICQCLTIFQIIPNHNYICKCISIWIYTHIYIYRYLILI